MKTTLAILFMLAAAGAASAAQPATAPAPSALRQPAQQQQPPQSQPPSPPQQASPARPGRQTYADRYSILTQRNVFLRDRTRGSSRSTTGPTTSTSSTQPSRRSPEETLLLRGIVVEQGEVRAYFEDVVNSRIVRVGQGDAIARGRIASIDLDIVEYEPTTTTGGAAGGGAAAPKRTFVVVGHDLTGKVSALDGGATGEGGGDASAATTGPVMPSGVAGLNPNDPNLTPEQKMKLRRAMELKK